MKLLDIAILAVASLASLGLGELVLRKLDPAIQTASELRKDPYPAVASDYLPQGAPRDTEMRIVDPRFNFEIKFNALGYLGDNPRALKKSKPRILLLGDSFTLGWGSKAENTFGAVLQQLVGDKIEVINAAYHDGVSPDAYYAYLQKEGLALDPDVVVLEASGYVDWSDYFVNVWLQTDATGAPLKIAPVPVPGVDGLPITAPWYVHAPLLGDSALFVGLGQIVDQIGGPSPAAPQAAPDSAQGFLAKMQTSLRAIAETLAAKHIKCLVLNIPPPFSSRLLMYRIPDQQTRDAEIALWGKDVIDLRAQLRVDDYSLLHGHFSDKGNRIVAELIKERLPERLGGGAPQ